VTLLGAFTMMPSERPKWGMNIETGPGPCAGRAMRR
jgi:hypothetical protein